MEDVNISVSLSGKYPASMENYCSRSYPSKSCFEYRAKTNTAVLAFPNFNMTPLVLYGAKEALMKQLTQWKQGMPSRQPEQTLRTGQIHSQVVAPWAIALINA